MLYSGCLARTAAPEFMPLGVISDIIPGDSSVAAAGGSSACEAAERAAGRTESRGCLYSRCFLRPRLPRQLSVSEKRFG